MTRAMALGGVRVPVANPLLDEAIRVDPSIADYDAEGYWLRPFPGSCADVWQRREALQRQYAWGIPCEPALEMLAALSPIVEVGAGTGYWASLLAAMGADVVAYDIKPGFNNWCDHEPYHPVQVGNWREVRRHQDRTLFMCWPYMNRNAYKALRAYQGATVAYVGEHDGGCCADDRFFGLLARDWEEVAHQALPQWWGIHDGLWIYTRRVSDAA